jgi:hypothetical protein
MGVLCNEDEYEVKCVNDRRLNTHQVKKKRKKKKKKWRKNRGKKPGNAIGSRKRTQEDANKSHKGKI